MSRLWGPLLCLYHLKVQSVYLPALKVDFSPKIKLEKKIICTSKPKSTGEKMLLWNI